MDHHSQETVKLDAYSGFYSELGGLYSHSQRSRTDDLALSSLYTACAMSIHCPRRCYDLALSVHKALCSWLFGALWRFGGLGLCGLLLVEFNLVDKEDHLWNGPVHAVQPDGDL
jgi:hypothetical protein